MKYWIDTAERVVATFVEAFLGVWLVAIVNGTPITDKNAVYAAGVSGIIAALSLVKSLIARFVGSNDSAAFLPGEES